MSLSVRYLECISGDAIRSLLLNTVRKPCVSGSSAVPHPLGALRLRRRHPPVAAAGAVSTLLIGMSQSDAVSLSRRCPKKKP